jgi:hypothetical protein
MIYTGKYAKYAFRRAIEKNTSCRRCFSSGTRGSFYGKHHTDGTKKINSDKHTGSNNYNFGKHWSEDVKKRIKQSNLRKSNEASDRMIKRYSNPEERKRMGELIKLALHRPDIRAKHLKALSETKYLGRKTDKGQLELLDKWNRLGFEFEPNYPLITEGDLFFIDGYDKKHNVVMEYDGVYHNSPRQRKKDLIRQQKVIDVLRPKKFWRYNVADKQCKNVV